MSQGSVRPFTPARQFNFDGLVGPTHNYGGLSLGNLASQRHGGQIANPRKAALQGLKKMALVHSLGGGQAILPPQERPHLPTLRALGYRGTDAELLAQVNEDDALLLRLVSSASSMWTANAATVSPSADTLDGRVHLSPANLGSLFHRSLEAATTHRVLQRIFANVEHFVVHPPLPTGGIFFDEGAANHTRLRSRASSGHSSRASSGSSSDQATALELFAYGRSALDPAIPSSQRFPARQTLEASRALARRHELRPGVGHFVHQEPAGIDAGSFHTDVLAVGQANFLMLHSLAFRDPEGVLEICRTKLGPSFRYCLASEADLPVAEAIRCYPFNSEILELEDGALVIIAPEDSQESVACRRFLDRVADGDNPVREVRYVDVRASMHNGGGPACLRLRVDLTDLERNALQGQVLYTPTLGQALEAWVSNHYRDVVRPEDLVDPKLHEESLAALDELTQILQLGSLYDFQH